MMLLPSASLATAIGAQGIAPANIPDVGDEPARTLSELLSSADSLNPSIVAARSRVAAATARVRPAGTLPDPMLMAGIVNLPLGRMASAADAGMQPPGDNMTMKMLGVQQTIPYPGKLSLRRRILERELDAANASLTGMRREISRDIKSSFYELAYFDQALEIVHRSAVTFAGIMQVTETQYAAGVGGQQDVLKARVEAARLGEMASEIEEMKRAERANLNFLLNRNNDSLLVITRVPNRISDVAVSRDAAQIRFTGGELGARVTNSPLLPLAQLQELAVRNSASLSEKESMVAAETARVSLAQKGYKPDFDFSLQYGQRTQRPDMISALVSIPIPIHKSARQNQEVAEAGSQLAAAQAEYRSEANRIRAEVARVVSEAERNRTQLALYRKAILPQGAAAVTSSLASYQTGKGDILSVLNNQSTLQTYQVAELRAMTDFAKAIAELEAILGMEVLQ